MDETVKTNLARLAGEGLGIVIAGHGSRSPEGVAQFEELMKSLAVAAGSIPVSHGFLEFASPTIDVAIRQCVERGARRIAVVPAILLAAMHAKNDMPTEVRLMQREFPEIPIRFGAPIQLHPLVLAASRDRIIRAEAEAKELVPRKDACLVVVGRGTTDPDANSDVYKLARVLEEGMGFGASTVVFSGTATPDLDTGLRRAGQLGFRRLTVFPFFLFGGVLMDRIEAGAERQRAFSAGKEQSVLFCDPVGRHEDLTEILLERAVEAFEGSPNMNCSLCKYRIQVVGYEHEVGTKQEGHHQHVRGLLAKQDGTDPAEDRIDELEPYRPHPIEAESFSIIESEYDWSPWAEDPLKKFVLQRVVHTTGDFGNVETMYFSGGALEAGLRGLEKRAVLVTDVTMVRSGLKRAIIKDLGLLTFCGVHDEETRLMAEANGLTRCAANIRRAWEKFGNDCLVIIGDAPTAITEALRLITEQQWRPHLVIGVPVGFVGTREAKTALKRCLRVPRITNEGTRGGSPWAACIMNALLIERVNRLADELAAKKNPEPEASGPLKAT